MKNIEEVNDFPKAVNNTQLRSFLRFIDYVRDHVPDNSNVVSPLTKRVDHSASKKSAIQWTPEGVLVCDKVKQLILVNPKQYRLLYPWYCTDSTNDRRIRLQNRRIPPSNS